jgi:ornithine decarboxylase
MSHLKYAAKRGTEKVTFDSTEKLKKIKNHHANAKIVLRMRFDVIINLGKKFGCDPKSTALKLIELYEKLKMSLIGIHFHVRSFWNFHSLSKQPSISCSIFSQVNSCPKWASSTVTVDLFKKTWLTLLDRYAKSINRGLDGAQSQMLMSKSSPGAISFTLPSSSSLKPSLKKTQRQRAHSLPPQREHLHVIYGMTFLYDLKPITSVIARSKGKNEQEERVSTIWGRSCNSNNKIMCDAMLREMEMGDWLMFHNMGAYSDSNGASLW